MLYLNPSCIGISTPRTWVIFLETGSNIATLKCRHEGAWVEELKVNLPYAYLGDSTKIWVIADIHTGGSDQYNTWFTESITDINKVSVNHVIAIDDLVSEATEENFDLYISYKSGLKHVLPDDWHEVIDNHDRTSTDPDGGDLWKNKLGYGNLHYTFEIGNLFFIVIGQEEGDYGLVSSDVRSWLTTQLEDNKDKNIVVVANCGVNGTTYATSSLYLTPTVEIQAIVDANRIDIFLHGAGAYDAGETMFMFKPLALYEDLDIEEGSNIEFEELSDSLDISESIKLNFCQVGSSKYNTFKFSQRKYGKNFTGCEKVSISEEPLLIFNGDFLKPVTDSISFSESLVKEAQFVRNLSDSISFSESLVTASNLHWSLSDSITIDDGFGISYVANLTDSVSIDTLLEIERGEGITYKSRWKFLIKDSSGNYLASLVNARGRWFTQRLNDQSEAGFILDADDDNCSETILALGQNTLEIEYKGILMWAGQLASAKKIANGNDIYWEVLAKDWVSLLSKRFVGVESLREFTTIDAGTIAWTLIDETQSLTYGDFGITEGTIETSITRSPSYDRKNLLEAIRELSNMGKDGEANYGFDFEVTPEKVFNIYYPYKGTIREDVVFRYPGNCENFEAFVDSWDIINQEWGLGRHWTGNTAIVSRADATSQATYKRREAIKNYHDMAVLEFLQDMVYQDIQWNKNPSTVVRFDARVDEKVQLEDYNVGDGVTVVCDSFDVDEWLWVYERKVEVGDDDEPKVTLTLGN